MATRKKTNTVAKSATNEVKKATPKKSTIASLTAEVEYLKEQIHLANKSALDYRETAEKSLDELAKLAEEKKSLDKLVDTYIKYFQDYQEQIKNLNLQLSKPFYQRWYDKLTGK